MTMLANTPQQEDDESITVRFHLTIDGDPLQNEPLTFSVSPDDGTAYLALFTASTDANGEAMFILQFRENASGHIQGHSAAQSFSHRRSPGLT